MVREIDEIICENLNEKQFTRTREFSCCEECHYFDQYWNSGRELYCCSHDKDAPVVNRDDDELYNHCPINHTITENVSYIKRYGVIHEKPVKDGYRRKLGRISIVDFKDTTYEWDGHNPDVNWVNVAVFFYETDEERDIMMKSARDLYDALNVDDVYVEKRCYG